MDTYPSLETQRLFLRLLEAGDASTVQRLAGDERVALMAENIPYPYEAGMAEKWISSHQAEWQKGTRVTFGICLHGSSELIGCIALTIVSKHKRASMGYWIACGHWGRGYCSEAASAIVDFGFRTLNLVRIQATHLVRNPASGAVMKKIGMQHEGTFRSYIINTDRPQDVEQYAILSTD